MGLEPAASYPGSNKVGGMSIALLSFIFHSMLKMVKKSRQMQGIKTLNISSHVAFQRLRGEMLLALSEGLSLVSGGCP